METINNYERQYTDGWYVRMLKLCTDTLTINYSEIPANYFQRGCVHTLARIFAMVQIKLHCRGGTLMVHSILIAV